MMEHTIPEVDVDELARKLASGESFLLLDVREAWEVAQASITDPRLRVVATSRLARQGVQALVEAGCQPESTLYVICHHGVRSAAVTQWLIGQGWREVYSVRGGIDEYARLIEPAIGKY